MRDNRGLTLVEVLITVVILSIVVAVAASFMVTGSRSFVKGNAESNLQKEAELTVNQIEDMIIDANFGIYVPDGDTGTNDDTDPDDDNEADDTTGEETATVTELIVYNKTKDSGVGGKPEYTRETVAWNSSGDEIFYSKSNFTYDDGDGSYKEYQEIDEELLAENVSSFKVDLEMADETASDGTTYKIVRSVRITVGYENDAGRVDYTTSPVTTLRNRARYIENPDNLDEIFN